MRVDATRSAADVVRHLISTQHHHDPTDDEDALQLRFDSRQVRLDDGTALRPSDKVPSGSFIWFYRRPAPERPVPGKLQLLYHDDDILVVDKPSFMSTLPRGQHITETAVVRARRQFGADELSPAHRLDRLTRGVLLFTTRREVRGAYQQLFEARLVTKTYEAVTAVPADWSSTGPTLRVPENSLFVGSRAEDLDPPTPEAPWILRHRMIKNRGRLATFLEDGPPNSETVVTGIRRVPGMTQGSSRLVWTLQPHSGRTHQLRVNLRLFGAPIINDPIYSGISEEALHHEAAPLPEVPLVSEEDFTRPMGLTARVLEFRDPLSGVPRQFTTRFATPNE